MLEDTNSLDGLMQLWLLACMTYSYNALDYANFMYDQFDYIV